MKVISKQFHPQGVTVLNFYQRVILVYILDPEKGTAAVDIYTCGECRPELGCYKIIDMMEAGHHKIGQIQR